MIEVVVVIVIVVVNSGTHLVVIFIRVSVYNNLFTRIIVCKYKIELLLL